MADSSAVPNTAEPGGPPKRKGFLMPPWPKGVSGNPSGRARDGGSAKDAPLRKLLRAKARRRSELRRLVDGWWDAACEGDAQAREQILKRLDPVLDDPQAGRQILTGLKLELQVGKGPITHVRGLVGQAELRGSESMGLLSEDAQRHEPVEVRELQESQSLPEGTQVSGSTDAAADPS